jgi:STE24 endopeptidase
MKKYFAFLNLFMFGSLAWADPSTNEAVEQAVRAYINTMSPEQLARSNAYFEGGYWLQLWNFLIAMVVAYILMKFGLSVKMRNLANRLSRYSFLRTMYYTVQYIVLTSLITFPMTIYQEYFREHQYEMSNLTLPAWFGEQTKALIMGIVLVSIILAVIYWIIGKFPKTWWVGAAIATTLFMAFTALIAPVFLAPVFNEYKPLRQGEVREAVLQLARANGVPVNEVYEFDASKQSKRISANVSGLFGTMRVSLNDNLLNRTTLAETRHVMGHELGHYVLGHVVNHIIDFGVLMFLGFYFIFWGMNRFVSKSGKKYQITSVSDLAAMPILFALFTIFQFVFTPINNTIIRTAEVQADLFGLNTAREPDAAAKVAIALSEYRKMSPGYWEEVIFYDHPSGENRIRAAMTWKMQNLK